MFEVMKKECQDHSDQTSNADKFGVKQDGKVKLNLPKIKKFSSISGISQITKEAQNKKVAQKEQLKHLMEKRTDIRIPAQHPSMVINFHGPETIENVDRNMNKHLQFSKHPYFNKQVLKMKHSKYMSDLSLYKMGQVDES